MLATRYNKTTSTIWRWRDKGILPEPLKISGALVVWTDHQVLETEARWLAEAKHRALAREARRHQHAAGDPPRRGKKKSR